VSVSRCVVWGMAGVVNKGEGDVTALHSALHGLSSRLMSVKNAASERLTTLTVSPWRGKALMIRSKLSLLKGRYSRMAGLCLYWGCSARAPRLRP
jgi:hypothetical protein